MSRFLIYAFQHPETGEVRYVGRSSSGLERARNHMTPSHIERGGRVHMWIKSLQLVGANPVVSVLEFLLPGDDINERLNDRERYWISTLRATGSNLMNHTDGGAGQLGRVLSLETRAKISATQTGKKRGPCSESRRLAISAARKGKPQPQQVIEALRGRKLSLESRQKISNNRKGIFPTAEARAKMSAAKIGKSKSEKTRRRMSEAQLAVWSNGRTLEHSADTKQKISEASRRMWAARKAAR